MGFEDSPWPKRSGTITPRLVRRAARTLRGEENSAGFKSGWFRRLVPYAVSAIVLMAVVFFMVYKGLAQ